jgi:hypothetical protein
MKQNYLHIIIVTNVLWLITCLIIFFLYKKKLKLLGYNKNSVKMCNEILVNLYRLLMLGGIEEAINFLKQCLFNSKEKNKNVLDKDK